MYQRQSNFQGIHSGNPNGLVSMGSRVSASAGVAAFDATFQGQAPRRRVTLAVADLPQYGKADRRMSSAKSAAAKKRKRSANISELVFSRLHKPNQPPYNLIRVWVNERNMQFYDCACGRRKAVQDLQVSPQLCIRGGLWCSLGSDVCNSTENYSTRGKVLL